jgi:hypothetical protein
MLVSSDCLGQVQLRSLADYAIGQQNQRDPKQEKHKWKGDGEYPKPGPVRCSFDRVMVSH